ncbi:hypothetical protein JIN85_05335 [Luteolibacter pohnpeiensis]|uniref:Uncharacterized protein n=1 Tax=Luteolibacter pohnpeiensis TaxID=454153 RepID=A0A934VQ80_9BACT|nr:hypothetical protein [Luteolibacter pohnpeiensis]MBK1881826.1 hypothetical protein [Luteolibacter pohnpeiensis]
MKLKDIVWLIPLPVGVLAFLWSSHQGSEATQLSSSRTSSSEAHTVARTSSLDEFTHRIKEINEQASPKKTAVQPASMDFSQLSVAELKEKLLSEKAGGDPFSPNDNLLEYARLLGLKEGKNALAWLKENCPEVYDECYDSCFDGWADADAHGAFAYLCQSDQVKPCSGETLLKLLQTYAGNAESYRQASDQVPWELFRVWVHGGIDKIGVQLADNTDIRPLLESGVAQTLAEEGFYMEGLFKSWASQDFSEALKNWSEWATADDQMVAAQFLEILRSQTQTPDGPARFEQSLRQMSPEAQERVIDAIGILQVEMPKYGTMLQEELTQLMPLLPADFQPQTDSDQ